MLEEINLGAGKRSFVVLNFRFAAQVFRSQRAANTAVVKQNIVKVLN